MKTLTLLTLILLISFQGNSQSLGGEWKGNFRAYSHKSTMVSEEVPITLKFTPTNNGYHVTSSTTQKNLYEKNLISTCNVYYKLVGNDSIYIEEKEFINPPADPGCLQKMMLKITRKRNVTILSGMWENVSTQCGDGFGKIWFRKRE